MPCIGPIKKGAIMNKNKLLKTALAVLCLAVPLFGQIVIDWYDIPFVNFTNWNKNIAYNQTVNLGSAGGPQDWYFTAQPMGNDSCWNIVVPASYVPFTESFPTANLFYASIDGPDSACLYMHLDPSYLANLGLADQSGSGTFQKYYVIDTNYLPEHYGDSRHYQAQWRYQPDAATRVEYTKRGQEQINAWGTVHIPFGSFSCLRYILWDTLTMVLYYNNVPVMYDTTTRIGHQFVAETFGGVVCVFSNYEETNPYFTNAAILERMTSFVPGPGVNEAKAQETAGSVRVQPNPFGNTTRISIGPGAESRGMRIYDAAGCLVRSFTAGPRTLALCWDGKDDNGFTLPAGVYFLWLDAGLQPLTAKIIKSR